MLAEEDRHAVEQLDGLIQAEAVGEAAVEG